jgi:hypothetical protein
MESVRTFQTVSLGTSVNKGKRKGRNLSSGPFLSASGDVATTKLVSLLPLTEPLNAIAHSLNIDAALLQCSTDALVVEDAE